MAAAAKKRTPDVSKLVVNRLNARRLLHISAGNHHIWPKQNALSYEDHTMRIMPMILIYALVAGPAMAKTPLRDIAEIDDAMLDLGIAHLIRKNCPDIDARMFRAVRYVYSLKAKARKMGYSDAEIESYTESDTEKARMKRRGAAYFKANGVTNDDPTSYCVLGRTEIIKSSRIGSLLRMK